MPEHHVGYLFGEQPARTVPAKPFVKWAGGKGSLLSQLEALLPAGFDGLENVTYVEPFVGGGALLFHMLRRHRCIRRAVINDINSDLVHCYRLIAERPQALIGRLRLLEKNFFSVDVATRKELYYAYRDQYNSRGIDPDERAALFVLLNHTCYNGLHRVNASGEFNVPFGRYKRPVICNESLLLANHRLLNSVELVIRPAGDYKLVLRNLSPKHPNFVYLDPPYRPLSVTSSFREYSNSPFGDEQQEELKQFCDVLSERDCLFMLSNSDSKTATGESYFEDLYAGYDIQRILAPRFIKANAEKRVKQTEVVIRNY